MIQVKTFYAHNDLRNFSYLLYEDQTGEAWVIDPYEASPFIDHIKKESLELQGILNTHSHFDHIRGNAPLLETFECQVRSLHHGETIFLNESSSLKALDTPGHTMDHQVFVLKRMSGPLGLFSGDTLFNAGVGNCKNGGNVDLLFETTMKLLHDLPPETELFPGHDYTTNNLRFAKHLEPGNSVIDEELKRAQVEDVEHRTRRTLFEESMVNPFLRLDSPELRRLLDNKKNVLEDATQFERNLFHYMRSLRDKW